MTAPRRPTNVPPFIYMIGLCPKGLPRLALEINIPIALGGGVCACGHPASSLVHRAYLTLLRIGLNHFAECTEEELEMRAILASHSYRRATRAKPELIPRHATASMLRNCHHLRDLETKSLGIMRRLQTPQRDIDKFMNKYP